MKAKMRAIWAIIRGGTVVYRAKINGSLAQSQSHLTVIDSELRPLQGRSIGYLP